MDVVYAIAKSCLLLSNDYLLMLIAIALFVFHRRYNYSHLIFLLLFSMIYKTVLKDIFKWPAPLTSPTTNFGFPSGHINFAVIYYGWFMMTYHTKLLNILCPLVIITTGWAMVYTGYHYLSDVLLTPFFAIFVLCLYKFILKKFSMIKFVHLFCLLALVCQIASIWLIGYLKCDAIIGSYGILGFSSGILLRNRQYKNLTCPVITLIWFATIAGNLSSFLGNCVWFMVFGIVPLLLKRPKVY